MRVLVTGSNGFVGRHFVRTLLDRGDDVIGVDNLSTGVVQFEWAFQPKSLAGFSFYRSDIRTMIYYEEIHPDHFDLIIHCAAVVGGRLKIENDPLAVATDLSIDAELFNWVVRGKKRPKVIYFSSSAVYPNELQTWKTHVALAESLMTFGASRIGMPDMTYGWVKLSGEYLAKYAVEKYGLPVIIYRPFGGYGEDQDFTYPFPSIIKRVLSKEDPIVVWGSGEQERDFIHIDDIVAAVLATMDVLKPGEVLNLGCGVPVSFKELAQAVCTQLGHRAEIIADTSKPEGVFSRVADTWKLDQYYHSKVSLAEGIHRVAKFLEKSK